MTAALIATSIGPVEVILLLVLLVVLLLPIYVGYRVGEPRDQAILGAVLGFFLSWLGVLIMLLFPKKSRGTETV